MSDVVGVIGLGAMGAPMARNLVAAGHPVVVHSRSPGPVEALVAAGARAASSPRELARAAEVIVAMLPDEATTAAILEGEDGLLAGARAGQLLVDMGTASPAWARTLAARSGEHGVAVLDAPVSGGDVGAQDGSLSIMVGGDADAVERARPVFEAMGRAVHVGPHGAGQTVKACNQVVVAGTIAVVSEALVLARGSGVDPGAVLEVLSGGLAASRVIEVKGRKLLEHDFEPGGKAGYQRRDLRLALAAAQEAGVTLPVTAVVDQLFGALVAAGGGDRDHSALLTVLEGLARPQE